MVVEEEDKEEEEGLRKASLLEGLQSQAQAQAVLEVEALWAPRALRAQARRWSRTLFRARR